MTTNMWGDGRMKRERVERAKAGRRLRDGLIVLFALSMVVVVMAGCKIQVALDTKIENNGSGALGIRLAADKEIQDLIASQGGGADLFGEFEKQVPKDWKVQQGADSDGTKWVTATKSFANPQELDSLLKGQSEGSLGQAFAGDQFSVKQSKGFLSTTTTFDAVWDASKALSGAGQELPAGVSMDMVGSLFQIENRVTMPGSIKEQDATEVQGKTLIWRPSLSGTTKMHAKSVALRWGIVGPIIGAGALVVAIIVVIGVLLVLRGRRRARPAAPAVPAVAFAPAAPPYAHEPSSKDPEPQPSYEPTEPAPASPPAPTPAESSPPAEPTG